MDAETRTELIAPDLNIRLICTQCQDDLPNLEESSSGDLVCSVCGLVVGDRMIDTRSEWRKFADETGEDPSRVGQGANPILAGLDDALETRIGSGSRESRQLQRTAELGRGTTVRSALQEIDAIQSLCDCAQLPKGVADVAKQTFLRAQRAGIARGKSPEAIAAAALFVACRVNGVPRTFAEICQLTRIKKTLLAGIFGEMRDAFDLGTSSVDAMDLVARFCSRLGLEQSVVQLTQDVVSAVQQTRILAGKSPTTICAACILFGANLAARPVTAHAVAQSAQVSEETINRSHQVLLDHRSRILTPALARKHAHYNNIVGRML